MMTMAQKNLLRKLNENKWLWILGIIALLGVLCLASLAILGNVQQTGLGDGVEGMQKVMDSPTAQKIQLGLGVGTFIAVALFISALLFSNSERAKKKRG